jgi:hypothetical protein
MAECSWWSTDRLGKTSHGLKPEQPNPQVLTIALSREGQITDRYGKAVEQLGHDKIEVQLGGIYALERLMKDSPADQPTITETLAAYVREHAPATLPPVHTSRGKRVAGARRPPQVSLHSQPTEDVQAILTVLCRRRPTSRENPLNLTKANLAGAHLINANLTEANLRWPTSPAPTSSAPTSPRPTVRRQPLQGRPHRGQRHGGQPRQRHEPTEEMIASAVL